MQRKQGTRCAGSVVARAVPVRAGPLVPPPATLALLALLATVAIGGRAAAAPVAWGTATTIAGDSDVFTTGSSVFAYNWANTNATVNGQAFVGTTSGAPSGLTFSNMNFVNTTAFTTGSTPFADLSTAYKSILVGSIYNATNNVTATATLTDLTQGRSYAVQLWVNDPRNIGVSRSATLGGSGGNTVSLAYPGGSTAGIPGQFSVGVFDANATTQSFSITPNNANTPPQVNALQLRDVTNIGAWTGINGTTWDASTTSNFASNLFSAALSNTTASVAQAPLGSVVFGDSYWNSNSPTTVTQTAVTIAAGGVSANTVRFGNSTVNYTVTSSDTIGLTGTSMLMKGSAGTVTLAGTNSYTGGTFIAGGVLEFVSGSLGSTGSVSVNGGTLRWASGNTEDVSSRLVMQGSGTTALDTNGNSVTLASAIGNSSSGGLVKTGSGTLTLSTASTYTGATTVTAGTLVTVGLGLGVLTVNSGAKLSWTDATNANLNPTSVLLDGGTLSLDGSAGNSHNFISKPIELRAGTLTSVNGPGGPSNAPFGFNLLLNGGTLTVAGSGLSTISMTSLGVANGGSFNVGDTVAGPGTDLLVSSAIVNAQANAGIIKNGGGTMELSSGSNAYNGPTLINAGTLALSGAGNIATSSGVNLSASGTGFSISAASGNRTIAALTGTAGSVVAVGVNALTVDTTTSGTFAGGINGTGGALIKQGSGTLGVTGAMTLNNLQVQGGTLLLDGGSYTTTNPAGGNGLFIQSSAGSTLLLRNGASVSVAQGLQIQQGTIDMNSGSISVAGGSSPTLYIGNSATTAALTMTGGSVTTTSFEMGNGGATSTLNLNGGTLQIGANPVKSTGAVALNMGGGTLRAGAAITIPSGLPFNLSGVNGAFTLNTQGFTVTATNAISGVGGMIKAGAGTLALTGINDYAGATNIAAGRLAVNGSLTSSSLTTVASGATLGGTGSVGATLIQTGGFHAPGNSPGIQTITNGLEYQSGSTLTWELFANDTAGRGTNYDGIDLTGGALAIDPTAILALDFGTAAGGSAVSWNNPFWNIDQSWTIIDVQSPATWNGGLFGSLSVGLDAFGNSLASLRPNASFSVADVNGDLTLQYVAVPEPGTLVLAGIGVAVTILCRRRKRGPSVVGRIEPR